LKFLTKKLKNFVETKKLFRVKGKLDEYEIKQVALIPMGKESFILPLNAEMRKGTCKKVGDVLNIIIEIDKSEIMLSPELLYCLEEEPVALKNFTKLPPSHQKYYSRWIESARTFDTKAKRIASARNALKSNLHYGEMIRSNKLEQ